MRATNPTPTWEDFKETFFWNYFPDSFWDRRESEFSNLVQGSRSVLEYKQRYEELYCFTPEHIQNDRAKAKKFEKGLSPSISSTMVGLKLQIYTEVVQVAKSLEDRHRDNFSAQKGMWKRPMVSSDSRGANKLSRGPYINPTSVQSRNPEASQASQSSCSRGLSQSVGSNLRSIPFVHVTNICKKDGNST
ncbi:uncharacterized protein LOC122074222 [Macadamia integrifolia]|uniref:uncharacterized protein LOC122074222 n=1 Tax=Macadamia integrifolia TaxID=60698 RepID=UPI001C4F3703|nr:uncharacterized protein LOC122074222 [Macadamia integrifolia]